MRQILERPPERVDGGRQLAGQPGLHGPRRLPKVIARLAVPEPQADPVDTGVDRQNRMIGCKEEHPMRAGVSQLRKRLQRPARSRQRPFDEGRQLRRAAEQIDAGPQRAQPLLGVRAGEGNARFELGLRCPPHRIRRERPIPLQRRERGVPLSRRRMDRQDLPYEQREWIARRRRQRAVKLLQRVQESVEPRHVRHSVSSCRAFAGLKSL